MKIALAQIVCKLGDVAANLDVMERLARDAHRGGADAIVFPEMSDTGYEMPAILRTASPHDGAPRRRLAAVAKELSMWVIAGLSLREGGSVFNTAVAIDRKGSLQAEYRKIHLFSGPDVTEQRYLAAGENLTLFDLEGMHTGLMICYDLRFPELARALTLSGAQAIIIPAAWPPARIGHWSALLTARAIENQLYMVGVNRAGRDGEIEFGGATAAVDFYGTHLHLADRIGESLAVIEALPSRVREARSKHSYLSDRRPEMYQT